MEPDDLPVEALKAGIAAWNDNQGGSYTKAIRMVIVEAIKAWPNIEMIVRSEDGKLFSVILPVPQEKAVAKDWTEQKAIEFLENENERLREVLWAWLDATRSDPSMGGPRFKGVSYTRAEKAWLLTLAALEGNND